MADRVQFSVVDQDTKEELYCVKMM
jgi:hypothetical protein